MAELAEIAKLLYQTTQEHYTLPDIDGYDQTDYKQF